MPGHARRDRRHRAAFYELRVAESFQRFTLWLKAVARQMRWTELAPIPTAAIMPEVSGGRPAGGSVWVRATIEQHVVHGWDTRSRVLSPAGRRCTFLPAPCQRQTQVFDLPVRRRSRWCRRRPRQQDDLGSHVLVRRVAILCQGLEPMPASRLERKRNSLRMRKHSM